MLTQADASKVPTLRRLFGVLLRVGTFGFGGPLATIALMREELVQREKMVTEERFLEGMAVVKLLPGPVSCLLSIFLGTQIAGLVGGVVAGLGYILPAFCMIVAICFLESVLASVFHSPLFSAFMKGIHAAVLAIILLTCWKLFKECFDKKYQLHTRKFFVTLVFAVGLTLALLHVHELVILAGVSVLASLYLKFIKPSAHTNVFRVDLLSLFLVFFSAAFTVFGTGYMVLPVLQKHLVEENGWLDMQSFLDAIAYGNLTPGPIVIASTHMGFKIAGVWGLLLATVGIFLPSFVLMLSLAPLLRRILGKPWIEGVLLGLLPAVAGSITASLWPFAQALQWTPWLFGTFVVAFLAIFKKISVWKILLGAGSLHCLFWLALA